MWPVARMCMPQGKVPKGMTGVCHIELYSPKDIAGVCDLVGSLEYYSKLTSVVFPHTTITLLYPDICNLLLTTTG